MDEKSSMHKNHMTSDEFDFHLNNAHIKLILQKNHTHYRFDPSRNLILNQIKFVMSCALKARK